MCFEEPATITDNVPGKSATIVLHGDIDATRIEQIDVLIHPLRQHLKRIFDCAALGEVDASFYTWLFGLVPVGDDELPSDRIELRNIPAPVFRGLVERGYDELFQIDTSHLPAEFMAELPQVSSRKLSAQGTKFILLTRTASRSRIILVLKARVNQKIGASSLRFCLTPPDSTETPENIYTEIRIFVQEGSLGADAKQYLRALRRKMRDRLYVEDNVPPRNKGRPSNKWNGHST